MITEREQTTAVNDMVSDILGWGLGLTTVQVKVKMQSLDLTWRRVEVG